MKQNKPSRPKMQKGVLKRILKMLFKFYPVLVPVTIICIIFSAVASSIPAIFLQKVLAVIGEFAKSGDWAGASAQIIPSIQSAARNINIYV